MVYLRLAEVMTVTHSVRTIWMMPLIINVVHTVMETDSSMTATGSTMTGMEKSAASVAASVKISICAETIVTSINVDRELHGSHRLTKDLNGLNGRFRGRESKDYYPQRGNRDRYQNERLRINYNQGGGSVNDLNSSLG